MKTFARNSMVSFTVNGRTHAELDVRADERLRLLLGAEYGATLVDVLSVGLETQHGIEAHAGIVVDVTWEATYCVALTRPVMPSEVGFRV